MVAHEQQRSWGPLEVGWADPSGATPKVVRAQ